jgi:hypothetical protein
MFLSLVAYSTPEYVVRINLLFLLCLTDTFSHTHTHTHTHTVVSSKIGILDFVDMGDMIPLTMLCSWQRSMIIRYLTNARYSR